MKRIIIVFAAALVTMLSIVAPAQAAIPLACTNGSYTDPAFPYQTHWLIGERKYGSAVTNRVTYRFWLHESLLSTPRFLSVSYARCLDFTGSETTIQPYNGNFDRPCSASGDYVTVVGDRLINHRLIGSRFSPPVRPPALAFTYRFWVREDNGWYLDNNVARCG
ncbi:hypothetical protein ACQPZF_26850 [Actinosynnema sp. CS-041913]|uniref:hypothetical protein n=1 Tax=Actinosynnema sp. CS-041913 TaxID=3239917 RepID=UPI003D93B395